MRGNQRRELAVQDGLRGRLLGARALCVATRDVGLDRQRLRVRESDVYRMYFSIHKRVENHCGKKTKTVTI